MRIVVATGNPHKLEEIRAVLEPMGFEVLSLAQLAGAAPAEPEEPGATFEENARIKTRYYAAAVRETVLADDSGLEVDALQDAYNIPVAGPALVLRGRVSADPEPRRRSRRSGSTARSR